MTGPGLQGPQVATTVKFDFNRMLLFVTEQEFYPETGHRLTRRYETLVIKLSRQEIVGLDWGVML